MGALLFDLVAVYLRLAGVRAAAVAITISQIVATRAHALVFACKAPLAPACVSVVCSYIAGMCMAAAAFISSQVVDPCRLPCLHCA